jgi:hypothetical protein
MFRKSKTTINGIELPDEFSGASIINNIAISNESFAYIKNGNIITGKIPEDGKLNIDDNIITIRKGVKGFNIRNMSINSSFSIGSMSVGCDTLQDEIDEEYDNVKRINLKESINDINLGISDNNKVRIKGTTSEKPELKDGILYIERLDGKLSLPRNSHEIEIDIKTSTGDIKGDIAHSGRIRTSTGDIDLKLFAPLEIHVETSTGDINVDGMISKGRSNFIPPNVKPVGTLLIETSTGDIDIEYMI